MSILIALLHTICNYSKKCSVVCVFDGAVEPYKFVTYLDRAIQNARSKARKAGQEPGADIAPLDNEARMKYYNQGFISNTNHKALDSGKDRPEQNRLLLVLRHYIKKHFPRLVFSDSENGGLLYSMLILPHILVLRQSPRPLVALVVSHSARSPKLYCIPHLMMPNCINFSSSDVQKRPLLNSANTDCRCTWCSPRSDQGT